MNILKDYGTRAQYSVFEVIVDDNKFVEMVQRLLKAIEPEEDSVRIYFLCRACKNKIKILGIGEVKEIPRVYIV